MPRLFWKLFLSFWIALLLFSGAIMLVASQFLDRMRAGPSPFERLDPLITDARLAAERGGLEGLRAWAHSVDDNEPVPMLLVDAEGKDLIGREVTPRAKEHVARRISRGDPFDGPPGTRSRRPDEHLGPADVAPPEAGPPPPTDGRDPRRGDRPPPRRFPALVQLADGHQYWLEPDLQGVTLGRVLARPRVIALPIAIAALVAALVCFFLARYLASPIERLRRTTLSFAAGKLEERVAPTFGRRRDEIVDLAYALDHMAGRLDSLIKSHKTLLRDVSHELRSPLARIEAALGLARQRLNAESNPDLDRIERETERLNDLIGGLLSLARLESGSARLTIEPVDLPELLETVAGDAELEAAARDVHVDLAPLPPIPLQGDAMLLLSAVENVVRNAVRHTDAGTRVHISAAMDVRPGWMFIRIRDHGPGVPDDMLDRMFEPFVRVGDARDRASGGHGIGLAIARRAALLHGGGISAENATGGGLAVTLRLPLQPPSE